MKYWGFFSAEFSQICCIFFQGFLHQETLGWRNIYVWVFTGFSVLLQTQLNMYTQLRYSSTFTYTCNICFWLKSGDVIGGLAGWFWLLIGQEWSRRWRGRRQAGPSPWRGTHSGEYFCWMHQVNQLISLCFIYVTGKFCGRNLLKARPIRYWII